MQGDFPACARTSCAPEDWVSKLLRSYDFLACFLRKRWDSQTIKKFSTFRQFSIGDIDPFLETEEKEKMKKDQMKIQMTTAAILAMGAFAGAAHAQGSVTLYGIADSGLLFNNNVKGAKQYALSSATSSRWGLLGAEDLGGGLKAIFDLENGYPIGTGWLGQGGLLFGRKAFVGLKSDTYGTLTAGRQYSASNDATASFASGADWAASGLGYGTRAGDVDNVDTSNRIQNSLKYQSPNYRGLTVGLLYSFGGQAGQFSKNEVADA